jgi:hypothetical protein
MHDNDHKGVRELAMVDDWLGFVVSKTVCWEVGGSLKQGNAGKEGSQVGGAAETPECIVVDHDNDPMVRELLADREMSPDSLEEFNRKVETLRAIIFLCYRLQSVPSYDCPFLFGRGSNRRTPARCVCGSPQG